MAIQGSATFFGLIVALAMAYGWENSEGKQRALDLFTV